MDRVRQSFLALALALFATTSWAAVITFTHDLDHTISGTLDAVPFTTTGFTITAVGDTTTRQTIAPSIFDITHTSAQIMIEGLGTFDFITPTRTFVNQGIEGGVIGFSRASGADLFNEPDAAFSTYDLLSSIGPVTGDGRVIQWTSGAVITTGGVLRFDNLIATDSATFTAVVAQAVPEPVTVALIGIALAGLGLSRRKRAAN